MAQDPASGSAQGDLPEAVRDWLSDLAADSDVTQEELLARLVSRTDDSEPGDPGGDLDESEFEGQLAELEATIQETDTRLRDRIAEMEEGFEEKIDDVRDRVIQVKRETDTKAHANHSHRELRADLDALETEVDGLAETVNELGTELESTVDAIDADHDDLAEEAEELGRKLDILANALLQVRKQTSEVSELGSRIAAVTNLTDAANRAGVREAKCESCRSTVDISLLTRPRCPHCQEPFNDFEPKGWFLGSNTLKTGARPALEGEVADDSELTEIADTGSDGETARGDRPREGSDRDETTDLRTLDGIGSSYAERLESAGIGTVSELATADPEDLADRIDVSSKLTSDWVDQARDLVRSA